MFRTFLAALFLLAALPAHAQFWASSAVNSAGVSKKPLTIRTASDAALTLTNTGATAGSSALSTDGGSLMVTSALTPADSTGVDAWLPTGENAGFSLAANGSAQFFMQGQNAINSAATIEHSKTGDGQLRFSVTGAPTPSIIMENPLVIGATGTKIAASFRATSTIDIASIAANVCATDSTITVAGAVTGAECIVGSPASLNAGLIQTCFVSAADTVKLRTCNSTAGAIDPASASYAVRVFNP